MTIDAIQLSDSTPQVLVIDDSEDVHRLLRTRLRQESLELVCASNGAEGLEAARELVPAVILLDLNMPELDGFEVLRTLKEDQATMNVPVIVLSGLNSPQDKVMAFDLGAMDYICKPFDLTELRIRVRSAVRLSELVQMLAQRAQIDGLTGLYNRAHFDLRWPDELAGCVRHGRAISLAIFDCDHFKSINDTYGHPAGDPCSRYSPRSSDVSAGRRTSPAGSEARSSASSCPTPRRTTRCKSAIASGPPSPT